MASTANFFKAMVQSEKECVVCAEPKVASMFPDQLASPFCTHSINTCTSCTRMGVSYAVQAAEQELHSQRQYMITCPECPQIFSLDVAQLYMDQGALTR